MTTRDLQAVVCSRDVQLVGLLVKRPECVPSEVRW